LNRLKEFGL